jgi:putative transposase
MEQSRFSEEQIAYALRLAEFGTPIVDVCPQIGVSDATYCTWKKKFGAFRCVVPGSRDDIAVH